MGADEKEKDGKSGLYRPLGLFTEVLALVRSNYVEQVDLKPLMAGAFSGMTEAMDPFSEYIPPEKMTAFNAYLEAREKRETIDSGLVLAKRFNYPIVVAAVPGSPGAVAGVKSDDVLEKVGDRPAHAMAIWEIDAVLSGKAGGRVRLLVVREGAKPRRRTIEIVRATWTPEAPSMTRVEGETVIRIPSFGAGSAAQIAALVTPLDRTRPIVLDLRGNALGSFDEAAHASALFVDAGPLGELTGRKIPTKKFRAEPGERIHASRLVLLVDSGTAGAAELFASAVRESAAREAGTPVKPEVRKSDRGGSPGAESSAEPDEPAPLKVELEKKKGPVRLVGEPTFGMGFSSQVVRLASGGSLKISVGKLRTVSGRALSPKGLEPDDRVFPLPDDGHGKTQPVDAILKRGLKILAEAPVPAKQAA